MFLDSIVGHVREEVGLRRRKLPPEARLVGINNRDLQTFEVKLETTERLAPLIPTGVLVVCESGIESLEQIKKLEKLGVRRFLVGETLMRAANPGAKLKELLSGQQSAISSGS